MDNIHVPPSLTALLQARFDRLQKSPRKTLQQAAVIGKVFWDSTLKILSASSQPPYADLISIEQRELIVTHEDSVFDQTTEYSFQHSLMRDVVYQTILKSEKQSYHGKIADWLVNVTDLRGRSDEYASIIGEHFELAEKSINILREAVLYNPGRFICIDPLWVRKSKLPWPAPIVPFNFFLLISPITATGNSL